MNNEYKTLSIYYWGHDRTMKETTGYDPAEEFEYSEAKLTEIVLDVINKGYQVQTRGNGDRLIICIDNKNFTTR